MQEMDREICEDIVIVGAGISGLATALALHSNLKSRCVKRKDLLETMERGEVPKGTIRYSSKVVSIEELGKLKLVHLADGSVFKNKVLIGCYGGNSMGLQNPVYSCRSIIRGFVNYPYGHGFRPMFHAYFGGGIRYGFIPCDEN